MPVTFLTDEDEKEYVRSVNGKKPDANGNVAVETGSGGGATPDWNAAEGEAGHILNRPFYKTVNSGMILENSQLVYVEDDGMFALMDEVSLTAGNEYTVTWNGADYVCKAFEYEMEEGVMVTAIGNKAALGEDPTEEPFFLVALPPELAAEQGFWGAAYDLTGATEVTVSIQGTDKIVTIPEEFIPLSSTKYIVTFETVSDYKRPDKTYDEVIRAIKAGATVVARLSVLNGGNQGKELSLVSYDQIRIDFARIHDSSGYDYLRWQRGEELALLTHHTFKSVDTDAIVQQVLDQLGTGVIGEVDADNNILITSKLPNGTYTMRYENADGSTTVIGTFTVSGGSDPVPDPEPDPEPTVVNLADPTSADWLTNKRIKGSTKEIVDVTESERGDKTVVITNMIPISGVTELHVKGLDILSDLAASANNYGRYYVYNGSGELVQWQLQPSNADFAQYFTTADYDSSVTVIDVAGLVAKVGYANQTHIRLGGILTGTAEDVIITADQNIV